MATTTYDVQQTFSIFNEAGQKLPGDLVVLAMANFIQTQDTPLLRTGMLDYSGGKLSTGGGFASAKGSTIMQNFPIRELAKQTTNSDVSALDYTNLNGHQEFLRYDKPIIAKKFKVNSFDEFLFNSSGELMSKVFNQMQIDTYKAWASLFYKNAKVAAETEINSKKRTYNLTIEKIKANPNLFIEWLEERVLIMERKIDKYTCQMPREEMICFAAPEVINAIALKLGELGRTVKFLETSTKYRMFWLQGVLVVEDRILRMDVSDEFVEGIKADLSDLNAILLSRRNQIFSVGKVEIKENEDLDWKDKIKSYRSLYTYKTVSIFADEAHALIESDEANS